MFRPKYINWIITFIWTISKQNYKAIVKFLFLFKSETGQSVKQMRVNRAQTHLNIYWNVLLVANVWSNFKKARCSLRLDHLSFAISARVINDNSKNAGRFISWYILQWYSETDTFWIFLFSKIIQIVFSINVMHIVPRVFITQGWKERKDYYGGT